jgi:hypothetical protein
VLKLEPFHKTTVTITNKKPEESSLFTSISQRSNLPFINNINATQQLSEEMEVIQQSAARMHKHKENES